MRRIKFHNYDSSGELKVSKTILAGCYKFGGATLLRTDGATMTTIIEIYDSCCPSVCVRNENIRNMKKERNFHKQVRVVYRACRKLYGKEHTQDECLKVFKLVFPELNKLRNSEEERAEIPDKIVSGLCAIFDEWKPSGRLKKLLDKVKDQMQMPFDWQREALVQFYEDITPVAMRIRKLTPRETGRLMGLDDEEIDIMYSAGLSNSAMYRLHGNSIVISTMYHMFRKLFMEKEMDIEQGKPVQLTLF